METGYGNDEKKGEKIPINRVKSRLSHLQLSAMIIIIIRIIGRKWRTQEKYITHSSKLTRGGKIKPNKPKEGKDEQMDPSKIRLIADLGRSGWRPPVTTLLAIAGISFKHIFSMYHWTGGAREFISGNQTKFASNSGDPEVNR
ncbi:hypothetical protein I7I51_07851 [Histoplasma capsulatum]|uniref:Uncharacterized protein n=1 Tax=Ajellomyces capsulatus TaxID=5037 RepID=A0A8A1LYU3_AJECA|nr:hypothetical protein I7I51_07851 [Histoplasma capsulatum]